MKEPSSTGRLIPFPKPIQQNSIKNQFFKSIVPIAERIVYEAIGEDEPSSASDFVLIKDAVGTILSDIGKFEEWLKIEYGDFLYNTGTDFGERAWINNSVRIKKHLEPNARLFLPIMNELSSSRLSYYISKETFPSITIEGKEKVPAVAKPDVNKIAGKLGVSNKWVYRYLEAIEKNGFILRLSEKGRGKILYYAIGVQGWYRIDKTWKRRTMYFLKESKENKEKLLKQLETF